VLTSNSVGEAVLMLPNLSGYASGEHQITFHNAATVAVEVAKTEREEIRADGTNELRRQQLESIHQ
jgi:hypothetical protein